MRDFALQSSDIVSELAPGANNPRNSEGAFLRMTDGSILFAYSRFSGSDSRDDASSDIAAIRLDETGTKVLSERPEILVRASEYDTENIMSVSLLRMENGDIGLFFIVRRALPKDDFGRAASTLDYILRRAKDGEPFRKETDVLCSGCFPGYYVINNDRVLRTKTGALLIPAAEHRAAYQKDGALRMDALGIVRLFRSDDDGATWYDTRACIAPPMTHGKNLLQEPGLCERPDGTLYLYMRTDVGYQYESFSSDGGATWSAPIPSAFSSACSPMKIAKNPYSGKYYAVWNPIPQYNGRGNLRVSWGRTPLVIAESEDGIRFSDYQVLESDENRGYCYPAVFFTDEKTMLLSYCSGGTEDGICLSKTTIRRVTVS